MCITISTRIQNSEFLWLDQVEQSRDCEQDSDDDAEYEESFLKSAAGMERRAKVIGSTECAANLCTSTLQENRSNNKNGQDYLDIREERLHWVYHSIGGSFLQIKGDLVALYIEKVPAGPRGLAGKVLQTSRILNWNDESAI